MKKIVNYEENESRYFISHFKHTKKLINIGIAILALTFTLPLNANLAFSFNGVQNIKSVKELLNTVEQTFNYSIIVDDDAMEQLNKTTSYQLSGTNVQQVMTELLSHTNLTYHIAGKQIIISPKETKKQSTPVQQLTQKQQLLKGTIVDESKEPLVGVNISVDGSTNGVISDIDGNFNITLAKGDVLRFSYIGFITQTVTYKGEEQLNVVLKEDTQKLDEIVVVGYGTTSKRKTTSAITSLKTEDLVKAPVPNITQSLAGRAPGLIVTSSGGGIGSNASISIRGGGTPLYVIDDIISEERDFQNLNPDDIDQMTILKDASATAVYGARAANGIVLISTKKGKTGKMNIDYSFNYNLSEPSYLPKKLGSYEAAYYVNQSLINDGLAPTYSEEVLQKYKDGSDPYMYPNTNWQDLCMRSFAPEQRHNLSISGGNEYTKVYTGIGYYDQESIYKTNSNNLQRYNFRTNIVTSFKEIGLKVTSGVEAYILKLKEPYTHQGRGYYTTWSHIQNKRPFELGYNKDGQIFSGTNDSPLIDISSDGGYFKQEKSSVRANLGLEWAVPYVEGLKLKALSSYTIVNDRNKAWQKTPFAYDLEGNPNTPSKPNLSKGTYYHRNFTSQFFADYNNSFGKHTVGGTVGMEVSGSDHDNSSLSRQGFLLDVDQMNAGPVSSAKNSSSEFVGFRRAALISRAQYDYDAKYIAEASVRYDGSDYFPKGNRWGTFFSGSLAWVVSEENFWRVLREKHILDLFKIRGSYGEIGLDGSEGRLGRYEYLPSYNLHERGGYIGGEYMPGFSEGSLVSKDITWYTSKNMNIGFDFASLNNRLSGSFDYFRMITKGYLASPSNVGYTQPLGKNLPKVKSNGESIRQGVEFVLQWKDNIGDLRYGISTNFTLYDNRWNINPDEAETRLKNPYIRGTQVGSYWGIGLKTDGFYKDYEDVANTPKRPGSTNLVAGDLKYQDFNGDGIIDGNDNRRIGKAGSPRGNYGIAVDLDYKGWFMNMLWQGATSYDIQMGSILQGGSSQYLPIIYGFQKNYWTPESTKTRYPRLHSSSGYNGNNNHQTSDFWLVNAAYIRLKNLSVGYDFKHELLRKVSWLSKCTLTLSGYNLLTFSPAKKYGMDPEIGDGSLYTYPISRVYSISLNLGF